MTYPHCERLGLLRRSGRHDVISTVALYRAVGAKVYRDVLPHLKYGVGNSAWVGPLPGPVEEWLRTRKA